MTPAAAFVELIARLGANNCAPVFIGSRELSAWPVAALAVLKAKGLLVKARPAVSAVCRGCERECVRPVQVIVSPAAVPGAFVLCDKRSDINRVAVPLGDLEQWQATVDAVADLLVTLLDLRRPLHHSAEDGAWQLGLLRGPNHSGYVKLLVNGELTVAVGGHFLALSDLLELKGSQFIVDRRRLLRAVNNPVAGSADIEVPAERQARIEQRVRELKAKRVKGFLKQVAAEESISVTRVKQIRAGAPLISEGRSAKRAKAVSQRKETK